MNKTRVTIAFALIGLVGVIILKTIGIQLAILTVLGISGWFIYQYNGLQALFQQIQESHSNIQVAMRKRLDLANKLMEIVANYADHESMTHLGVAKLESPVTNDSGAMPSRILGSLQTISRNYPELRANQTYQALMDQLEDLEDDLQRKRELYNIKVRTYNASINAIPMVFVADRLGFVPVPYFDATAAEEIAGLAEFKTADGAQLKSFISDLGSRIVEKSERLTDGIEKVTRSYLDNSNGANKQNAPESVEAGNSGRKALGETSDPLTEN